MIVLCVVVLTDRCARTYTHSFYFQSEQSQNRSSKRGGGGGGGGGRGGGGGGGFCVVLVGVERSFFFVFFLWGWPLIFVWPVFFFFLKGGK